MFLVVLLMTLPVVVGAMLTALPRLEGRLVRDLAPGPVDLPASTGTP